MKRILFAAMLLVGVMGWAEQAVAPLPAVSLSVENKKIALPGGESFTYAFAQKPQMGVTILKVMVKDAQGRKDTSLRVTGRSGMPAMQGAHDSDEQKFLLNKKGDYLLPLNVVMPGEWEVHLMFYKGDRPLFHGVILFEV